MEERIPPASEMYFSELTADGSQMSVAVEISGQGKRLERRVMCTLVVPRPLLAFRWHRRHTVSLLCMKMWPSGIAAN